MRGINDDGGLDHFISDRLAPLLKALVEREISKSSSKLRTEVAWLKARIVVLETELKAKREREAA
jgi:hypothetical protein